MECDNPFISRIFVFHHCVGSSGNFLHLLREWLFGVMKSK